jgi:hypothetical protein
MNLMLAVWWLSLVLRPVKKAPPAMIFALIRNETTMKAICFSCCQFKGPDTSHCYSCGACVRSADHHSTMIGQCVSKATNYRSFFFMQGYYIICLVVFLAALTDACLTIDTNARSWLPEGTAVRVARLSFFGLAGVFEIVNLAFYFVKVGLMVYHLCTGRSHWRGAVSGVRLLDKTRDSLAYLED